MTDATTLAADRDAGFGLSWRHPLHGFQLTGIARLLASDAALLADEMGLGKTIQAIAALRILAHRRRLRSALVVMPVGLLLQWRRQFRAWAPELSLATVTGTREERILRWRSAAEVHLVGYEVLRNDRVLPAPFGPGRRVWDVVVLDEAQRIKNEGTELSVVLKSLERERSWALTGTPVENRAEDAASIIDFVAPGKLDRSEMMVGLRRALGEVQLRRRRTVVLPDLPPKTGCAVEVTLGTAQRAAYVPIQDHVDSDESVVIPSALRRVAGVVGCGQWRTAVAMTAAGCGIRAT